jgi:hypothetical protein
MYILHCQNIHNPPPWDLANTFEKSHTPPLMTVMMMKGMYNLIWIQTCRGSGILNALNLAGLDSETSCVESLRPLGPLYIILL